MVSFAITTSYQSMTRQNILKYFAFLSAVIGISSATPYPSPTTGPQGNCTKVSSCKCSYPDGSVIDLSPLSKSDGTAYFSNITSKNGSAFYWNPCNPFSYLTGQSTSACGNTAVCQLPPNSPQGTVYNLGTQTTATFTNDKGGVHLSYASAPQGGRTYAANVILKCNNTLQNSVLDVNTIQPYVTKTTTVFSFILNSKYACSSLPSSLTTSQGSQTTSTVASETSELTSSSKKTSTGAPGTSETSQGSTGSTRRSSITTPVHKTTTHSGTAAASLKTLHYFAILCFTIFMLI